MILKQDRKVGGPFEKPRVNHGGGQGRPPSESNCGDNVKSNAAKSLSLCVASNGGVTEVVHRMLLERSIDVTVTPDADLREIGLTSLDMVDLVLSVECEFDLQIPEAQITPANFRSISAIDALVNALRG